MYAKDNIAVCVCTLLCGIYVCIELMLSVYVLPAMCCQTWTLHVPQYTSAVLQVLLLSFVTPGYLPQLNTVTLEEQMLR